MDTAITSYGAVAGEVADGVIRFLGIPYAASPTGPLRFQPPEPPQPWEGVRDCTAFGPTPPSPGYAPPFDGLLLQWANPGDDWLNLNVWTTSLSGSRPVMVFIHGGAFVNGNSAVPTYEGSAFARDGVVLVSINYRLGVYGFALLPDAPPNRGLLDQVAALEWVRDNIAAFGGDPDNVTIFGESAGAMSVCRLLAMPRARGLFHKAIAQSGSLQGAADPADAALVAGELSTAFGGEATAASLADAAVEKVIAAQTAVGLAMAAAPDPARFGPTIVAYSMPFVPVIDGDILPADPLAAFTAGAGADIPLLIGTNTDEWRFFFVPTGVAAMVSDQTLPGFLAALGLPPQTAALYGANRPDATAGDVLCAIITDRFFRNPAFAVAEARADGPARTYLYEFAWRSPVQDLGAAHAVELPFVFDNLGRPGSDLLTGPGAPAGLAREVHETWIRFATTGEAGWQPVDASYPVMTWDGEVAEVVTDPRGDERRIWSAPEA
jgi:para-nitrobenzyl esterase